MHSKPPQAPHTCQDHYAVPGPATAPQNRDQARRFATTRNTARALQRARPKRASGLGPNDVLSRRRATACGRSVAAPGGRLEHLVRHRTDFAPQNSDRTRLLYPAANAKPAPDDGKWALTKRKMRALYPTLNGSQPSLNDKHLDPPRQRDEAQRQSCNQELQCQTQTNQGKT